MVGYRRCVMVGRCIFIGGRQIGVNCLRALLKHSIKPDFLICEIDDDGKDGILHESLAKEAIRAGIETLRGVSIQDPVLRERIQSVNPEIIFHVGGTQIIPKKVIEVPKLGVLNIHPALLPKYRGRYSTVHALFNGEKETGATIHFMDKGIDSGPIVLQEKFPIEEWDTGKTLWNKFTQTGTLLFVEFLEIWLSNKAIPMRPQNEADATYYSKGLPNNGKIDWDWDGQKIKRFIRAMTFEPFSPVSFEIGEKEMVIIDRKISKDLLR